MAEAGGWLGVDKECLACDKSTSRSVVMPGGRCYASRPRARLRMRGDLARSAVKSVARAPLKENTMKYLVLALVAAGLVGCSSDNNNDDDTDTGTADAGGDTGGADTVGTDTTDSDAAGVDTTPPPVGDTVDALVQAYCEIEAPCELLNSCDAPTGTEAEQIDACVGSFDFSEAAVATCDSELRAVLNCYIGNAAPACVPFTTEGYCESTDTEDGTLYSRFTDATDEACETAGIAFENCVEQLGFECEDGTLVPWSQVCDGTSQCADSADEPEGLCEDSFRCDNQRVIPSDWICDGDNDCGDMSDEQDCE